MTTSLTMFILGACAAALLLGACRRRSPSTQYTTRALAAFALILAAAFVLASSTLLADPWLPVPLREIGVDVILPGLAGLTGAGLIWGASRLRLPMPGFSGSALSAAWLVLPALVLGASLAIRFSENDPDPGSALRPSGSPETAAAIEASVPAGYRVEPLLALPAMGSPTAMTFGAEGALYLAAGHEILRFPGVRQRGAIDEIQEFADPLPRALGLAERNGVVYASSQGSLLALSDTDGDGRAEERRTLIDGLPHQVFSVHSNNGLAFDEQGYLYMGLGGTSDHGPERDPIAGSVLRVDVQTGEYELYARGLRNPYGLTFCPDGGLYASDNGPDDPDDDLLFRPPDEVNRILEGRDYGYPDHYGYPPQWSDSEAPVALLPYNSAATGIHCYEAPREGQGLPGVHTGDLLVTLWGSASIPEQTGKKMMHVSLRQMDGELVGAVRTFASGFINPIDVLQDASGALWVADYGAQQLFRISFED